MSHHYRGSYKRKFVSSSSSETSGRYSELGNGDMSCVPPPESVSSLPTTSLSNLVYSGSFSSNSRDRDRKKEEEYANLVFYGGKSEKAARKKRIYDDEYLEGGSSDEDEGSRHKKKLDSRKVDSDGDDDLDAFMAGINQQAEKDKEESQKKEKERQTGTIKEDKKGIGRADIDEEDMQESYFKFLEERKEKSQDDEDIFEYDEDGNIIWTWKKIIDPLPSVDHSSISYADFHKNFYKEHADVSNMTPSASQELRNKLGIRVGGFLAPKAVCSFAHFGFDKGLIDVIIKSNYEQPTPIQAQAIPAALSGRDVLGIAKTGSGKTAAYLWPAITHIMDQPDLKEGEGPIALVVVPTRELALQVSHEAKKFCKVFNINVICAYGGGSKWEQSNELKQSGAELVICTPGRIIDLVKMDATNFLRTTFLVFDEADRMFDMGFEAQVMSISDHIRPDRQCLMFSATFKRKVERLARDALRDPVRIVQGEVGEANADVLQTVDVLPTQEAKWNWLTERLVQFSAVGKVLIFVTKKLNSEDLARKLRGRDFELVLLHGDMLQAERNDQLATFRKKINIMVATDVAARGLDIPEIRTVINYDLAKDIDTHVHRIGRTGRAGQEGNAYTLVTDKDMEMAGHLVRNLESVDQMVPPPLLSLAMKSSWFRSQRSGGGHSAHARTGLGYQPKIKGSSHEVNLDPLKETTTSVGEKMRNAAVPVMSSGPAASSANGRLSAMKMAFKSSFASTFHASKESLPAPVVTDPRPEWKKKIDELNNMLASKQKTDQSQSSSHETEKPMKKRSRWE